MRSLLRRALGAVVKTGCLEVVTTSGACLTFGDGSGEPVRIRFTDTAAQYAFLLDPDLRIGELFMAGRLIAERSTIYDFLVLLLRHGYESDPGRLVRLIDGFRLAIIGRRRNHRRRARRNVAHHYDIDDRLYALFLDSDWQYSCAYFEHPGQDLEQAQRAKMRHIASKLIVRRGDRILDIGSGWGALACYLAEYAGAGAVVGATLSESQFAASRRLAAQRGLSDRVSFRLQDYRDVGGAFDRIVSVGMFEHVGLPFYPVFFQACRERLTDDGVMLLHTIGSADPPSLTNPWLTRYIFPGGHIPSLSDIVVAIEKAGLIITDIEVLRVHYADTLRAWRANFLAHRAQAAARFDERFCRMWEYYLSMSEAAFRHENIVVFQIQLAKRLDGVPRTRDYIATAEGDLRSRERAAHTEPDQCHTRSET